MTVKLELPELSIHDGIQVNEMVAVTARLTELLRAESQELRAMRIRAVGEMQEEKNMLISWLEAQKKIIALTPEMKDRLSEQERAEMTRVAEDFAVAVEENYHQASIARAVNQRVVQAINDSVRSNEHVNTYNAYGATRNGPTTAGLPFNVNQKA